MHEQSEAERPDALYHTGLSLYNQRHYQEALDYFNRAIEEDATLGEAWAFRGLTRILLQEPDLPLHDIDQALALLKSPSDEGSRRLRAVLLFSRALALYRSGRYAEAVADFESAAAHGSVQVESHMRQGDSYRALGQPENAIAAYRRALNHPEPGQISPDMWVQAAQTLLELGDYHAAIEAAQVAIRQQPENALGWTKRARALMALKRHQECLDSVERALALDDQDFYSWGVKGAAARGLRRYEEAREAYHRAYMLTRSNPPERAYAYQGEFRMLLHLGRFGAAWRITVAEMEQRLREQRERGPRQG